MSVIEPYTRRLTSLPTSGALLCSFRVFDGRIRPESIPVLIPLSVSLVRIANSPASSMCLREILSLAFAGRGMFGLHAPSLCTRRKRKHVLLCFLMMGTCRAKL